MSHDLPVVRLTLDHMRFQIIQAFNTYADGLKDAVDHAVTDAVEHFDYQGEINKMAGSLLSEIIREQLRSAFMRMKWDEAVQKAVNEMVRRELTKGLDEGTKQS